MIRNKYKFERPLTDAEVPLLKKLICWRPGSSVIVDPAGAVIGCVAHPDDVAEFHKELRKSGAGRKRAL
jgi:hypothetical protein